MMGQLLEFYINLIAEVPSPAWVNLQPAKHFSLCKQFSKMFPSAFSVLGLPGPGGGGGQTCTKSLLGQVGMCVENFIKIGAGGWISISPPIPTDKQTSVCPFLYI